MTGDQLREWRKAAGMTQSEAAEWWTGDPAKIRTWRRWEKGESAVPAALAKRAQQAPAK